MEIHQERLNSNLSAGPISEILPASGHICVDEVTDDDGGLDEYITNILVPEFDRLNIDDPQVALCIYPKSEFISAPVPNTPPSADVTYARNHAEPQHTNCYIGGVTLQSLLHTPMRENTEGCKNLLNQAEESMRRQIVYKTNRLYIEQGQGSSKAFLSAICTLSTEGFDRLWTGVFHAPTNNPTTPSASDTGRSPLSLSKDGTSKATVKRAQVWEGKFERFAANAIDDLIRLVASHWEQLTLGLETRELQGNRYSGDKRLRRLYHHLELRKLEKDGELHWLRRALALLRNLWDFEEYLKENGHPLSQGLNQRLRHAYLTEIYAADLCNSHSDAKTAFKEDLRYATRWMIFIGRFGLGAILICGEAISKLVYKTSGNNNGDLEWLATQIQHYHKINFQVLCDILHTPVNSLIQHYRVGDDLPKSRLIARIQIVTCRTELSFNPSLA